MADIVDATTRSRMMSGIRGKNTRIEVMVRKALFARGFRYRLHNPKLPGKPDIVLPKYRAAVFIHGCFWHGHNCRYFKWPETRRSFWEAKISGTRQRDERQLTSLLSSGWRVAIIWECAVRDSGANLDDLTSRVASWLNSENIFMELPSAPRSNVLCQP